MLIGDLYPIQGTNRNLLLMLYLCEFQGFS